LLRRPVLRRPARAAAHRGRLRPGRGRPLRRSPPRRGDAGRRAPVPRSHRPGRARPPPVLRVPGMSDPAAIGLRGVSKRYGTQLALEPTSIDIAEGEFFCLLGPSGCGKTTTLNLIGGFVNPSAGEIWIRDERVDSLPPHRRRVNTVFQSYALFPHMSVRDNVGFGLKMARVPSSESKGRIEEAPQLVG